MPISLGGLNKRVKEWLNDSVRIDRWALDMPSALSTKKNDIFYPANTAVQFPPMRVQFEKTAFGLHCRAEFNFRIVYRFSSKINFDLLPFDSVCNLINNLYYDAVIQPGNIEGSIVTLSTPQDGIDIQVQDPVPENKDWLMHLNPQFYIEFKANKGDDSSLNPPKDIDPVIPISKLDIAIYRGDIAFDLLDSDTFNLDRLYHRED